MLKFRNILSTIVLTVAVLGSGSGVHALDNKIGNALQNNDLNPPLQLSDNPRIEERMILLSKRCLRARQSQRYHDKMNYVCAQKDPDTYFSTQTCRCETLI